MYCNSLIDGKWPCAHSIRPCPCNKPFFIISPQYNLGITSPLLQPLNGQISTGTRWCDRHHYILINPFFSQQHSNYNLFYDTACCERGDGREGNRKAVRGTNSKKRGEEVRGKKPQRGEDVEFQPWWGEEILRWVRKRAEEKHHKHYDWLPICHCRVDIVKAL